jgi:RNA polymerase sigma factor (sigma-70 family)
VKQPLSTRKTLLFRVQDQKDEKSWEEFAGYYRKYIYMVARNMRLSHHDAEDILQRTLLKLWENLPKFKYDTKKGSFRSWLCTIIRNMVINLVKKKSRMLTGLDDEEQYKVKKYLESVQVTVLEEIAEKEWRVFLANSAWNNIEQGLTDKVKAVYLMLQKGVGLDEVAEKLTIQKNTVYVYKLRVQEKLAREVKRLEEDLS